MSLMDPPASKKTYTHRLSVCSGWQTRRNPRRVPIQFCSLEDDTTHNAAYSGGLFEHEHVNKNDHIRANSYVHLSRSDASSAGW